MRIARANVSLLLHKVDNFYDPFLKLNDAFVVEPVSAGSAVNEITIDVDYIKEWLAADGKPKYDFLVPPIVRADAPKARGAQVCPALRINLQYTHSDRNYAANAKGCFVPPL